MRTKISLAILVVAISVVWTSFCYAAPVKIGMILTLSGPVSVVGQDQYDGFMLALEQNKGSLGGVPVEVVKKDDQMKPDLGSQLAQELIEKYKVDIITGVSASNVMMAIYKKIIDSETILIGSNAGPSPIAGAMCSPYFFSTSWQNDNPHENAGHIATLKGYKNLYLVAANYQAGKDALAGFKRFYKGNVVEEVYTPLNQPDYGAEIAQISATKPDAVYLFIPGSSSVNFVKQYTQAGLTGKIPLLSSVCIDGTTLPAVGSEAVGLITGSPWEAGMDNPASKKFTAAFQAKYKRFPSSFSAQGYDAAMLIASALKKTKGNVSDKSALMAALKEADFESLRGSFKFNTNQFPITDWYEWEVKSEGKDGKPYFVRVGKSLTAHRDAYYDKCPMK